VQPAQTLGIVQASHGRPLPGGGHERGLNQVIGQGMIPLGQGTGVAEQARGVRVKTLPQLLSVILRDLLTAHLSLQCETRAVGGNSAAGQDHRTLIPGTGAQPDSTRHRRQGGAPLRQAAGSHERGSDDRQGTATAARPPRQGRCPHATVAAAAESALHL